jgi:hypothetical protein
MAESGMETQKTTIFTIFNVHVFTEVFSKLDGLAYTSMGKLASEFQNKHGLNNFAIYAF